MFGLVDSIERTEKKADRWLPSSKSPQQTKILWKPNPGPQTEAYYNKADILGYGGAAGGGKSHLALGLAFTQHRRSVIFRRVYPNLKGIIEDSIALIGSDKQYNKTEKVWRVDGRLVEFGAMQYENDKFDWRGRPHDLYVYDEATEFSKSQIEFTMGWLRTTQKGQRCRVILTFNPPLDDAGSWVIDYFLPWFAFLFPDKYTHPNPARPGELRYYATIEGKEVECDGPEPFEHQGETIRPLSRTFIPAKLTDNPYLSDSNYATVLQSLPEPLRSQLLYGDFAAAFMADPWQVIPTAWVKLAQKRWMEQAKPDTPLSGVGVDVARGGKDALVISKRFGHWFDEPLKVPGANVEDGPAAAGLVHGSLQSERHIGYINIDVIGVGTSPYDSLKVMYPDIVGPVNAASTSDFEVKSEKGDTVLKMRNTRAEYHWRLRMALDPEHGDNLALPPGNEIVADLCAAKYKMMAGGVIQIEEKAEIKERIGRSPDIGEAIMLAHLAFASKWKDIKFLKV